jgi:hypothetical protein
VVSKKNDVSPIDAGMGVVADALAVSQKQKSHSNLEGSAVIEVVSREKWTPSEGPVEEIEIVSPKRTSHFEGSAAIELVSLEEKLCQGSVEKIEIVSPEKPPHS